MRIVTFKGFTESLDNESSSFAMNSYGIFVGPNTMPKTATNEGVNIVSNNFETVKYPLRLGTKQLVY